MIRISVKAAAIEYQVGANFIHFIIELTRLRFDSLDAAIGSKHSTHDISDCLLLTYMTHHPSRWLLIGLSDRYR